MSVSQSAGYFTRNFSAFPNINLLIAAKKSYFHLNGPQAPYMHQACLDVVLHLRSSGVSDLLDLLTFTAVDNCHFVITF